MADAALADAVLHYMLRSSVDECLALWFGKSVRTDAEIRARFGTAAERAARGEYDHWAADAREPRRLVALAILLDQFPRNLHRGSARMHANDARCLALVKAALRRGAAETLAPLERALLCLVLTHSEALADQRLCLAEWQRAAVGLAADDPLRAFDDIFERHIEVIRRHGRFPHRNAVLGRPSSAGEQRFLSHDAYRFDLPMVRRAGGGFAFAAARAHPCDQLDAPAASASAASVSSARPCWINAAVRSSPSTAAAWARKRVTPAISGPSNAMPRDA